MKILHICGENRPAGIITQGLIAGGYDFLNTKPYYSKGNLFKQAICPNSIIETLQSSDFILIGEPVDSFCEGGFDFIYGKSLNRYQNLFNSFNLWDKVVHYEYHDSYELNNSMIKSKLIFKRSMVNAERVRKFFPSHIKHIDYCVMDEFLTFSSLEKIYNIGCFFNIKGWIGGKRRENLREVILNRANEFSNSLICSTTGVPTESRRMSISQKGETEFLGYLRMLSQTKIVFTAEPENCEGDNRIWEALASKTLLFCDIRTIKIDHFPENGKHCIYYDAMDKKSINEAITTAKYYLKNENERVKIANAAYQLVMKYHRPINRVNYILDEYNKLGGNY